MRKILMTTGLALSISILYAQEPLDAIRYSWMTSQGTARAQSIGGATTALGGDITSLYSNPAGLGLYKTGEIVLTPGFSFISNKSSYRGGSASDNKSGFTYGPIGLVYGIPSRTGSKWKNMTLGIGISRSADFNNRIYVDGNNNQSSFSEKYIERLINDGVSDPNDVENNPADYSYGPQLAFNTYLIDTFHNAQGGVEYFSSTDDILSTGLRQQQMISTKGGISDFSIGLGGNYNDVFYIGGSLNINTLRFTRTSTFTESDVSNNPDNYFNYFTAEDYLKTDGVGASIKLGIMFKPVEALRVGISFHSPSWYSFKDTYTSSIETDTEGYKQVKTQSSLDINDGYSGEYSYRYRTPMRLGAGLAYMFGTTGDVKAQKGFITADIEYVSYKGNAFNSQDNSNAGDKDYFSQLNGTIDNVFKNAINMRVGGELKFETIMVRAGFSYYGNPYTSQYFNDKPQDNVNGSRKNITGGLGWRNKGVFIDLAYIHQIISDGYYPYRLESRPYNSVSLKSTSGTVLLTVGFKF